MVVAVVVGIYLLRGTDTPTLDSVPAASPTTVQSASSDAGDEADTTDVKDSDHLAGHQRRNLCPEQDEQDETSDSGSMVGFEGRPTTRFARSEFDHSQGRSRRYHRHSQNQGLHHQNSDQYERHRPRSDAGLLSARLDYCGWRYRFFAWVRSR